MPSTTTSCLRLFPMSMMTLTMEESSGSAVIWWTKDCSIFRTSMGNCRRYLQIEPFLERSHAAKCLRIYFSWSAHPINGCDICQTIDAHPLMHLPGPIRCAFPQPYDSSPRGFIHHDEAACPSRCS